MRSEIISGDFPGGATLEIVGFFKYDVLIIWHEGFNDLLAGYLSLLDNGEMVLFSCCLKDGRSFIAVADRRVFNVLLNLVLK